MEVKDNRLLVDTGAWFGNVSSSILIIFVNKVLMSEAGYGFRYGILLAAAVCSLYSLNVQTITYD